MVKLIAPTGGESWVHETRLDEYQARGYKVAPPPPPPPRRKPKTPANPAIPEKEG